MAIPGLHHLTAICGAPQANLDYYVRRLGQRLVKRTVNFDDPGTYHLYYADRTGTPGTIMTFFPFADAAPGRAGPGMATAVAYRLPVGELEGWMARLAEDGEDFRGPFERFGARAIALRDPDGLTVELIEDPGAREPMDGFHSVTLWCDDPEPTARVLTELFGYEAHGEARDGEATRLRFAAPGGARGAVVDLLHIDAHGIARPGAGTIHHVAFRAESDDVQRMWRERVRAFGLSVTPVIDRQYFNAIYFREPGGVLFEIATDPPGFAVDEAQEALGSALKLPERYEPRRDDIERRLPPITVPS
ncbi:ring-cleaving dioxygenase [Acuticoccus sp.]|uniref:ring-cleaving dioxygenase n=1 Tax=Acuticoccus sp. TaxID=1904378 RepID=UPI003B524C4B